MQIVLARPRGFCAGVTRAIEIVERALAIHGAPVYVFHEIVHNGHFVRDLEAKVCTESVPDGLPCTPAGAGVPSRQPRRCHRHRRTVARNRGDGPAV